MVVDFSDLIDAAADLAWRPTCNLAVKASYCARYESAERLVALLPVLRAAERVSVSGSELTYLLRSIRRAAACSYANRRGEPYYERKEAIYQLRGCLDVWMRSVAA